jgi:predicted esterase
MSSIGRARKCAKAVIHPLFAIVLLAFAPKAACAEEPEWLPAEDGAPDVLVFPPATENTGAQPITVMLHGMCGAPENECPAFADAVTKRGFLICPRATVSCAGGGSTWSAAARAETIEAAIDRVLSRYPGRVDAERRTLVGFSLGAFVASDLVSKNPERWPNVVLLSAKIEPRIDRIAKVGVSRLLLGAGDLDLSKGHMMKTARRLEAAGVDTTFSSLGKVGHRFAFDMNQWMDSALSWLEAPRRPGA